MAARDRPPAGFARGVDGKLYMIPIPAASEMIEEMFAELEKLSNSSSRNAQKRAGDVVRSIKVEMRELNREQRVAYPEGSRRTRWPV